MLACAALFGAVTTAGAAPYFSAVGETTIERNLAASATLPDGRVLVIGGEAELDANAGSKVESFSPQSNSFSPAGGISINRHSLAAAVLSDGRVLVVGGESEGGEALSSAEIFNPATNDATPTGSMLTQRVGPSAVRLPDGRVLVAGGTNEAGKYLATAEIYDPATGKFSSTGSMAIGRELAAAAPLGDGRVLVAGGVNREGGNPDRWVFPESELYDPATGTFTQTGELLQQTYAAMAAPLPDGRVLVAGGLGSAKAAETSSETEIYDPATGKFTASVPLLGERARAIASPLLDGRVLVAAGGALFGQFTRTAETFNTDPYPTSPGLDFGSQALATASSSKPLLITNRGAQPLHVTSGVSLGGPNAADFSVASDGCAGATITNSQSCRVDLVFKPSAKGARGATIQLTDDAAGSPQSFSVTGTGVAGKPPKTKLGKHPPKKLKTKKPKVKATFKFSSSIKGATFTCKLDKGKFKPCKSPKTYKLKSGPHKFQVRATAGGTTGKPVSFAFKVVRAG